MRWIFPGKVQGFFVDVGAYDGISISNTYALEKEFGWQGICVEANQSSYSKLVDARRCHCANVCLLDRVTQVDYLEALGTQNWHPAMSGIQASSGDGALPPGCGGDVVTKETDTLEAVLERFNAPAVVDYLSIDTEGSEYLILKNFPFDRYLFMAITIEHNRDPVNKKLQRELLTAKGYVRLKSDCVDDYWIHSSHPRAGWLRAWHILRNVALWLVTLPRQIRQAVRLRTRLKKYFEQRGNS